MPTTQMPFSETPLGVPIELTNVRQSIHVAVNGTESIDAIFLWLVNTTTGALTVTIDFGLNAGGNAQMIGKEVSVPARSAGKINVCDGQILQNQKILAAYIVGATSGVNAVGYVVRTTP